MSIVYQQPPKNYLYQIGLCNVVDFNTTPVTRNGIQAAASLQTLTVPINAAIQDGQTVSIIGLGTGTSVGTQQIDLLVNGNVAMQSVNAASGALVAWLIQAYIMRRGTSLWITSLITAGMPVSGSAAAGVAKGNFLELPGFVFPAGYDILFRVTSGNAGDTCTQQYAMASIM